MNRFMLIMIASSLLARASSAGRIFLSDAPTTPTPTTPALVLQPGQSGSLWVWAELASNETIPGLAYDIKAASAGVVSGTAHVPDNPSIIGSPRWNSVNAGTLGQLVTGSNFVKVGGGLNGAAMTFDPTFDQASGAYRVARIDFTAAALGQTDVFLAVGSAGIALGSPGNPVFFGFGDAAIPNNAFGATSVVADASITVVPEPAVLLVLAPLALLRTRRG